MTMKCCILSTILPMLFIAVPYARAEEKFEPAARAKAIAPYIDEQTVAVGHVDLTRFQVEPFLAAIKPLLPGDFSDREKTELQTNLKKFHEAGIKEFYVLGRLSRPYFFLAIPLAREVDEKPIRALFPPILASKRTADALLIGETQGVAMPEIVPDPRPELAAAFEAAGDTANQLVFMPPKHFKRVIEEIMPRLPKEIGDGESTILTKGCLWAALGADLSPQLSIKLVVQSQDAENANALRAKWNNGLHFAAQLPAVKTLLPNVMNISESLMPGVDGNRLMLALDDREGKISSLIAAAGPTLEKQRENAYQSVSMNNLKQIALAMHNYLDATANKRFPPPAIYSKEGKPLLSWRVMILPLMDEKELYKQFHLDEPWDSPNNIKLIAKMPAEFRTPNSKLKEPGRTNYLVPVGPGTVFEIKEGAQIKDIGDGMSQTILAVEADDDHAVVWTKPEDWTYDPKEPAKGLGGHFDKVFLAVMCDGSVHTLPLSTPAEKLRAWFTADGKEPVPLP
jgi:hypothetical protein